MKTTVKRTFIIWLAVALAATLCSSCLFMTGTQSARVKNPSGPENKPKQEAGGVADPRVVGTWELLYRMDDNGKETPPRQGTRTLIEFTDNGDVIFNRSDRGGSDRVKSRTGRYTVNDDTLNITDDSGYSAKITYRMAGDTLITSMVVEDRPTEFYWRRYR